MRRETGLVILLTSLAILIHDAGSGRFSVFREQYNTEDMDLRLMEAAASDKWTYVRTLLRRGAHVNSKDDMGHSILHFAAAYDRADVAAFLVATSTLERLTVIPRCMRP